MHCSEVQAVPYSRRNNALHIQSNVSLLFISKISVQLSFFTRFEVINSTLFRHEHNAIKLPMKSESIRMHATVLRTQFLGKDRNDVMILIL